MNRFRDGKGRYRKKVDPVKRFVKSFLGGFGVWIVFHVVMITQNLAGTGTNIAGFMIFLWGTAVIWEYCGMEK
jgi:hypothetical protein